MPTPESSHTRSRRTFLASVGTMSTVGALAACTSSDPGPEKLKSGPVLVVGQSPDCDFYTGSYTSDDLALKAAFDALPKGYSGGGSILIKRGTYSFANGVDCSSSPNIHIAGEGMATIIAWKARNGFSDSSAGANWLLTVGGYSSVSKIQFVGKSKYACPVNGVKTYNAADGENMIGGGLRVKGGSRVWLRELFVGGMAEDGITLAGYADATCHANKVSDVYVIGCGGVGVNSSYYTYDTIFTGVWIGSCRQGMYLNDGGVGLVNCHIWGSEDSGVHVNGSSTRFICCYIESNGTDGIYNKSAHRMTVSGCDFWQNGAQASAEGVSAGIRLVDARNCSITGNSFRDNIGFQIAAQGSSAGLNVITSNIFSDVIASDETTGSTLSYSGGATKSGEFRLADTTNAPFKQNHVGRWVSIPGAGADGGALRTRITALISPSEIAVKDTTPTAVTGATYRLVSVLTAIDDRGGYGHNIITDNQVPSSDWLTAGVTTGGNSVVENNYGVHVRASIAGGLLSGGTIRLDLKEGAKFFYTLASDCVLTVVGTSYTGIEMMVSLTQDGAGSRTIKWPANFKFAGSAPELSVTANTTDIFKFVYDGTNWCELGRTMNM